MNVTQAWNDVLHTVIAFLPKLAVFLVILVIGWLIAAGLRKVVKIVLRRLGFDRAVERGGIKRALASSRYDASGFVAALVYYAVLLIALQMAFGVFGPNPISAVLAAIVAWLPRAIVAVVIVVVAAAIANALRDLIGGATGGLSYGPMLARLVQVVVIAFGVIAALSQIGIANIITGPVLFTVLATVGGVIVIGVGGGLLRPMQARWDRWLDRAEHELPRQRSHEADRGVREETRREPHATGTAGRAEATQQVPGDRGDSSTR
ncbi:mechanosensitive ion channel family protein [Amycolatopsis pigmentata]|uniref:Uncharacterized protein n=1 Tax=Amycolatopsis pigmentata TaxID=450801 RepID=A0ABW5G2C0_9PSEU